MFYPFHQDHHRDSTISTPFAALAVGPLEGVGLTHWPSLPCAGLPQSNWGPFRQAINLFWLNFYSAQRGVIHFTAGKCLAFRVQ
jgi:hypothetical protein